MILILFLGLELLIGGCQRTFAGNDPGLLEKQTIHLFQQGKYQEAIAAAEKLLASREKELGPEDPKTVLDLRILALMYEKIGDYAKAEPLFQKALEITKKVFGPEHPETARCLNNLALLYEKMGDYAKAEPLYQKALEIAKKVFGPEHTKTVQALKNLAHLYEEMGDYTKAEPLYQKAIEISRKELGPENNPFDVGLPIPSARFGIRLCESAGKTLGELSDNLCDALGRAGYTDRAIYPYQDGFAVLTRFERRDTNGNPSSDRWPQLGKRTLPLSKLFSLDYLRALFLGQRGVFRFFIFTLTSEFPDFTSNETTPAQAITWLLQGPTELPKSAREFATLYPFRFTSIVYDFEVTEDHATFIQQSNLTGLTEFLGSRVVAKPDPQFAPRSICFDSHSASFQ